MACIEFILVLIILNVVDMKNSTEYGYLSNCRNTDKSVTLTEEAIRVHMYAAIQIHLPATNDSIAYMHRRRYSMENAVKGIGTDSQVDFNRRKTAVFLGGYPDSANLITSRVIMAHWAALGYNTIMVDGQRFYLYFYTRAIRSGYAIGNVAAHLLRGLMDYGLKPEDIHLVGMSLGGQTISFVAKNFFRITGRKVSKILAMDPSGPCFRGLSADHRLSPSDADFVQVIHTGIDGFGTADPQGHVDFYLNGGEWQFLIDATQPWCDELCSHTAALFLTYFAITFHPDKFVGVKCRSVQQAREHRCYDNLPRVTNTLGLKADPGRRGIYYVPVRHSVPFFAEDGWMERKTVYPLQYNDALSGVPVFTLSN